MHSSLPFVLLAAFMWGTAIAVFMQFTRLGEFLSKRLTWFVTALGSGGNLLLLLFLLDESGRIFWWYIPAVFFVSSLGPSLRGILIHQRYFKEWMDGARDTTGE